MKTDNNLSNRAKFVRTLLTVGSVGVALLSYFASIYIIYGHSYPSLSLLINKDFLITCIFISIYWGTIEVWLGLNEVYRSRSYGYVVLYHVAENIIGVILLTFSLVFFGLANYGRDVIILFGLLSTFGSICIKLAFYTALKHFRRNGYNSTSIVFYCDREGESILNSITKHYEWGYQIKAIIGDQYITDIYKDIAPTYLDSEAKIEEILTQDVDEFVYARKYDSSKEILRFIDLCQDLGVTFRLYSQFLNRISANTQLRYFDTNAVITISNTPTNYFGLLVKRIFDILFASCVILCGLPFFILVALLIKLDSRGPIFFKQKRSGLKGKIFEVYKFRTMVTNAEELKAKLMSQNEMDGPAFKMTNDPRITRIGRFLRKSGIDEFPQFINVFLGDMSIVGPRPPLPNEVAEYERWQLRRLAMKPGITCLWQISPNRNSVSFDDWMRLDLEYIDNWKFTLDLVIILKTIRTMLRADGK
ncbi:MAG: sugar transferase [Bacteroidia bacterium]|nr:sugar transferase [Bacteroidia bacterium]